MNHLSTGGFGFGRGSDCRIQIEYSGLDPQAVRRETRRGQWPSAKPWPGASGNGWPGDNKASPRIVSHFGFSVPLKETILSPFCNPAAADAPLAFMLLITGAGTAGTPYIKAPAKGIAKAVSTFITGPATATKIRWYRGRKLNCSAGGISLELSPSIAALDSSPPSFT